MVIDPSAIVAMIAGEDERKVFLQACRSSASVRLSAAGYLEAGIVLDGRDDPVLSRELDELLTLLGVIIEPVSVTQARIARRAYKEFGRGSGHPARLNFGDCFSYALAIQTAEPLLFKGTDFAHTDVLVAV
ncbi:MAG TPA: type II toxin-antitoxin system VapC family toxin [Nakamurella sp.]|nr:type II toxin-antitoxin system VapC family toxin [Nakamurella sp.]